MFGRNAKGLAAQATILDAGTLIGNPQIVDGYGVGRFDYEVEVNLSGQPATRAIASGLACTGCKPEPGDVINVKYFPNGTATFELARDERYDPVVVAKQHVEFATAQDARYAELEDKDGRGVATVIAVRAGRHRFTNVEIRSDVHIKARSGEEFDATIVEWISESFPQLVPKVGEERQVLFDPVDPSKVAWRNS